MSKISDVCSTVRSKNAGPFWVTIDLFFARDDHYRRYRSGVIGPQLFATLYGTDPDHVKVFHVDNLSMMKISFPRTSPQGGIVERDMHSGQAFVRLLNVELDDH